MRIDKMGEAVQQTQPQTTTGSKKTAKGAGESKVQKVSKQEKKSKGKSIEEKEIIQIIEKANKSVKSYDRKLEYAIHEKTHEIMVKVIDTSGDREEIIREIPSEKVLDMVARMWELAGIMVDEKA